MPTSKAKAAAVIAAEMTSGCPSHLLFSPSKKPAISQARGYAVTLLVVSGYSLTQAARALGLNDHTSALYQRDKYFRVMGRQHFVDRLPDLLAMTHAFDTHALTKRRVAA